MKKVIVPIVTFSLFVMSGFSALAFEDVGSDQLYSTGIDFLASENIVSGYKDGTFKPSKTLDRAEMIKIIAEGAKTYYAWDDKVFDEYVGAKCFDDVPTDEWYTKYVCYAKSNGWVKGYADGTYRPSQKVSFVEALKMTMYGFDLPYSEKSEPWYKDSVVWAAEKNYIPIDISSFDESFRRDQMADLVSRIIKDDSGHLAEYLGDRADVVVSYDTISNGLRMDEQLIGDGAVVDSDYYNNKLDIHAFKFTKVADAAAEISFDLDNNGDVSLEDLDLVINFGNGMLNQTAKAKGKISVSAGKSEHYNWTVFQDGEDLSGTVTADFYMEGKLFYSIENVKVVNTGDGGIADAKDTFMQDADGKITGLKVNSFESEPFVINFAADSAIHDAFAMGAISSSFALTRYSTDIYFTTYYEEGSALHGNLWQYKTDDDELLSLYEFVDDSSPDYNRQYIRLLGLEYPGDAVVFHSMELDNSPGPCFNPWLTEQDIRYVFIEGEGGVFDYEVPQWKKVLEQNVQDKCENDLYGSM